MHDQVNSSSSEEQTENNAVAHRGGNREPNCGKSAECQNRNRKRVFPVGVEVAECVQRLIRVNGGIPEALFRFRGIRILFCFLFLLNPILRKACGQISPFLFLLFPADCKSDNQRNYSQNEHNQRQKGKEDLLRGIINRCIIENLCKFCAVDNLAQNRFFVFSELFAGGIHVKTVGGSVDYCDVADLAQIVAVRIQQKFHADKWVSGVIVTLCGCSQIFVFVLRRDHVVHKGAEGLFIRTDKGKDFCWISSFPPAVAR